MQEKPGPTGDTAPRGAPAAGDAAPAAPAASGASLPCITHPSGWRRWSNHGVRLTFWMVLALTLAFVGAVMLARFWLIPNADSFRPRVVQELSRLSGQRVVIGGFEAGWNGWSPELKMTRLQMLDARGKTLLQLPEVDTTISWRSLFFFEPRLSALTVRAPRVIVRRTAENALTVAGIDVDLASQAEGDTGMIEWLLKQRLVQISGGEIEWQDEWRKLPPLRLRNVNIRLVNSGSQHSLGMNAEPPSELAAPIDLRCQFTGNDLRKISDWDGLAYLRADYANLGLLTRYFPLPVQIARGEGGIQAWFEFDDGEPVAVTTDLAVKNARLQLTPADRSAGSANAVATAQATDPLDVQSLSGRLSWRYKRISGTDPKTAVSQQRWSVRGLNAVTASGVRAPASAGELVVDYRGDAATGGSVRAPELDLGSATSLARTMPLPADLATRWQSLQPGGVVRNIDVRWRDEGEQAKLGRFQAEGGAELDAVSWREQGGFPGASGVSGVLSGSSREGEFRPAVVAGAATVAANPTAGSMGRSLIDSVRSKLGKPEKPEKPDKADRPARPAPPLALDFGKFMAAPLAFDVVRGKIAWKRAVAGDGTPATHVDFSDMQVENADAAARFSGTWDNDKLGPGVANISGSLSRAETTAIHRYLPLAVGENTRQWLKQAILAGTALDTKFTLKGALWHFPFRNDEHGVFDVVAQVNGGVLDYADRWPRAEAINTRLNFHGTRMEAQVASATIAGVPITPTEVKIADMGAAPAVLDIRGGAAGPMDALLRWAVASPVNGWLDGFLRNAKATGNGRLNLSLTMPLDDVEQTRVNGELALAGNRLELGGDIPPLDAVNGRLRFTQSDVRATDVTAEALGGPLKLNISTEGGRVRAQASGTAQLEKVREQYAYPLVDQLSGPAQWQLDMVQPARQSAATTATATATATAATPAAPAAPVEGTLQINASTLQPRWPLDSMVQVGNTPRDATAPIKFSLARTQLERGRDRLTIELPGQLHAILERTAANPADQRTVERATLDVGAQKTALPARGYALRGEVMRLDTDAAIAMLAPLSASGGRAVGGLNSETGNPDFVSINLRASEAILYGHRFNDVSLRAQPSGQRWRLALRSREATGVIALDTHAESGNVDAVSVRLQRLSLPAAVATPPTAASRPTTSANDNLRWPALDLIADSFLSDGRDLGKLEVRAQPQKEEWRIEQVKLSSPDGSIEAKGRWRTPAATATGGLGTTEVDVSLKWNDAGKFMSRFGLPKGVERGQGGLTGTLGWAGSPAQFSYAKLGGKFALETARGRFTEMEPGIAKLLGVLSLQSLPRRLSFNFDDLFGRGFAFDEIKADVTVADGVAKTDGFNISGPSARVQIRGSADINRETQDLQVRVFPSLSTATAIGIGVATANPAIGAAALLGQKLARDPIERMLMQEFEVRGTWAAPDVKQSRGMLGAEAAANGDGGNGGNSGNTGTRRPATQAP